jgi:hypothetical protein
VVPLEPLRRPRHLPDQGRPPVSGQDAVDRPPVDRHPGPGQVGMDPLCAPGGMPPAHPEDAVLDPGGVWRERVRGVRDRYSSPATPSSRYRLAHPRNVRSAIPKTRHRSSVRTSPSRYCLTARSLNFTPASTMTRPRRGGKMCWHLIQQYVSPPCPYHIPPPLLHLEGNC